MDISVFYAYRYFSVHSGQMDMFTDALTVGKKNVVSDFFIYCEKEMEVKREIGDFDFILVFCREISKDLLLFKFAKDIQIDHYNFDENKHDITLDTIDNFPYIFVLVSLKSQIILLENNFDVFSQISTAKNYLYKFIQLFILDSNYTFTMDEIISYKSFWALLEESEEVFEIDLNFRSPNLFGLTFGVNSLLRKIKELYNNNETQIKLKNNGGNLVAPKEDIEDSVKYISSGGGNWRLKIRKKNWKKPKRVTSDKNIKTIEFDNFRARYQSLPGEEIIVKINESDILQEFDNEN